MAKWATTTALEELLAGTYTGPAVTYGRTINARFQAPCGACGKTMATGDRITSVTIPEDGARRRMRRWVHAGCADDMADGRKPQSRIPDPTEPEPESAPTVSAQDDLPLNGKTEIVKALIREVAGELDSGVYERTRDDNVAISEALENRLRGEFEKALADVGPTEIRVRKAEKVVATIEEVAHERLQDVVDLATMRKHVLLVGPTGSGKTHLSEQVAKVLGLRFAHISCSGGMSEGQLLGRFLPVGADGSFGYVPVDFVDFFENGGVFLLDEIDGSDPNTLVVINAALANGKLSIPNRPEKPHAERHPDFVCLAAANTFGTGATRQYVGREQLDEATLDRFRIGTIELDYDPKVEAALCPDEELRTRVQELRKAVEDAKLRRIVSMRFAKDAYEMFRHGWSREKCLAQLTLGWSADEKKRAGI